MTSDARHLSPASGGAEGIDHIAMLARPNMTILDMIGPQFCFAGMSQSSTTLAL